MRIETLAVHSGREADPATGSVAAPIYLSTTFERDPAGDYPHGYVYSRSSNPNRVKLEQALAAVEGGSDAAAFSSGLAASMAVFQALEPGSHAIVAADTYHGLTKLVRELVVGHGIQADFIDMANVAALKGALQAETKLIWIETPSNPLLKITNIAAVTKIAHEAGAICACDNTWAPVIQRPLDLDVDLVVHSTTKYFGGHSDVTGGAVVAREASPVFERIRNVQGTGGAVPSPFDCWLVHRGIQTLPWRMRAHCDNAAQIAQFLNHHAKVAAVHYPGLPQNAGHIIAAFQMNAFGGMLSFEVKGGRDAAISAVAKTTIFTRATSLGGVESLIEHRASVAGEDPRTPPGLLRLSVGLENAADLIEDLDQALR